MLRQSPGGGEEECVNPGRRALLRAFGAGTLELAVHGDISSLFADENSPEKDDALYEALTIRL